MKLRAPKYYADFKCIADRCRHSCCIGWEIDIDSAALEKYRGTEIEKTISYDETAHFTLGENERCPHLDGSGLCRIISSRGEGFLCDICREHPRFYHDTPNGREAGIGMSCEEACRIILSSDSYAEFIEIGDTNGKSDAEFDATEPRSRIYEILSGRSEYSKKLNLICKEFDIAPLSAESGRELLSSLEYLEEEHKALFLSYTPDAASKGIEQELCRALAYFVFRHCSDAESEEDFRASLGLSLFCERLLASISTPENIQENARIISEEIEYSEENTDAVKFEFF